MMAMPVTHANPVKQKKRGTMLESVSLIDVYSGSVLLAYMAPADAVK
jgi:phenylalanyl-tRNA synthetase beta subunit